MYTHFDITHIHTHTHTHTYTVSLDAQRYWPDKTICYRFVNINFKMLSEKLF